MSRSGRATYFATSAVADRTATTERAFRVRAAWALWYLLFQAGIGLTWDIRWHGAVGRDSFWTPPHLLIYSGVLFSGLLCLAVVLVETSRYRRNAAGVSDVTTWPVLGLFRAPLGFIVAGCGTAVLLAAAPLDNWWHLLYGIDVALWTPFHMMGVFGALIATVGSIYAFAALAAGDRRDRASTPALLGFRALEWGALLAISSLLSLYSTALQPATTIAPTIDAGPLRVLTYPVLLGGFLPGLFLAAVRMTGRAGAATAVLLLFLARQVLVAALVPWGIKLTVELGGYTYRTSEPRFSLFVAFSALAFLPTALAIDLLARRFTVLRDWTSPVAPRLLTGAALIGSAPLLLAGSLLVSRASAIRAQVPPEFIIPTVNLGPAVMLAVLPTLLLALVGLSLGAGWGAVLRLNDR